MADRFNHLEVRNEIAEKLLRDIGIRLKDATEGTGFGFALLVFEFEGSAMFYTSNAQRESIIQTMEEFIKKFREN